MAAPRIGDVVDNYTYKGGDPNAEASWELITGAPAVGQVLDGYVFQGGDPNSENNWLTQAAAAKAALVDAQAKQIAADSTPAAGPFGRMDQPRTPQPTALQQAAKRNAGAAPDPAAQAAFDRVTNQPQKPALPAITQAGGFRAASEQRRRQDDAYADEPLVRALTTEFQHDANADKVRSLARERIAGARQDALQKLAAGQDLDSVNAEFAERLSPIAGAKSDGNIRRPDNFTNITKNALMRALKSNTAMAKQMTALGAKVVGMDATSTGLLNSAQRTSQEAGDYPAAVRDVAQARSVGEAATRLYEGTLENLPQLATSIGGGLVGKAIAEKALQSATRKLSEAAGKRLLSTAGNYGAAAGAGATSIGMEAGSIYGDIYDETGQERPGVALIFGAAAGALDAFPAWRAIKTAYKAPIAGELAKTAIQRYGVEGLKQVRAEAWTEAAQTFIEKGGVSYVDGSPVFNKANAIEALDAAFIGGGIGGVTHIASQGVNDLNHPAPRATIQAAIQQQDALQQRAAQVQAQAQAAQQEAQANAQAALDGIGQAASTQDATALAAAALDAPLTPIQDAAPVAAATLAPLPPTEAIDASELLGEPLGQPNDVTALATAAVQPEPDLALGSVPAIDVPGGSGTVHAGRTDRADAPGASPADHLAAGDGDAVQNPAIAPGAVQAKVDVGSGAIVTSAGTPYTTEAGAERARLGKGLTGYTVQPIAGGFGLLPAPAHNVDTVQAADGEIVNIGDSQFRKTAHGFERVETPSADTTQTPAVPAVQSAPAIPDGADIPPIDAPQGPDASVAAAPLPAPVSSPDAAIQVARIGGKHAGESISVRPNNGQLAVLYNGEPLIDYDSEQEVTVPLGADINAIKQAVKASGQFRKAIITFDKSYQPAPTAAPVAAQADVPVTLQPEAKADAKRITNIEDYRTILGAWLPDLSWAQAGGHIIRGDDGQVSGRTTWEPKDYALDQVRKEAKLSYPALQKAVQKALDGKPLSAAEKRGVQALMRYADEIAQSAPEEVQALPGHEFLTLEEEMALDELAQDIAWGKILARIAAEDHVLAAISQRAQALQHAFEQQLEEYYGQDVQHAAADQGRTGQTVAGEQGQGHQAGGPAGASQGQAHATRAGGTESSAQGSTQDGLALTGQTPAQVHAQQQAQQRQRQAELGAQARAQADAQRNDFTLTGSNREADQAAARGAQDLFGAPENDSNATEHNYATSLQNAAADAGNEAAAANQDDVEAQADAIAPAQPSAPAPQSKLVDFGEKIGGARKDLWQTYQHKMAGAQQEDIGAVPLSKSWPEPDYQGLLDGGANPFGVAYMHAARDEIPTKPQKGWKLKQWVQQVLQLRDASYALMNGDNAAQKAQAILDGVAQPTRAMADIAGRVELYQLVGHAQSLKGVRISYGEYSIHNGIEYNPAKGIWTVEKQAAATAASNWPRELATGATRAEALQNFKAKYATLIIQPEASKEVAFDIYSKRGENGFWVGKKVGRNYIDLERFESVKEARAYKTAHNAELVAKLEKFKEIPPVRRDINNPRVGEDHRAKLGFSRLIKALVNRANVDAKIVSDFLVTHTGQSKAAGDIDIKRISMLGILSDSADDMSSALRKNPAYMTAANFQLLRNLSETDALTVEGFSKLNTPSRRIVEDAVALLGHNDEVIRSIVELIPVDMVNLLSRNQLSPETLLRDKSVLKAFLTIDGGMPVAGESALGAVLSFVREIASGGAKVISTNNPAWIALKGDSAVMAGEFDGIAGKSLFSHDVTPEDFQDEFSFYGVEFGNYVENSKRQQELNDAYDALMDMAAILGIPPKAISLNGELGLAFGARGVGGIDPAKAHYERDFIAINMTKKAGAGSLGHEWWHALDNYFSRMRGKKSDFMTEALDVGLSSRDSNYHYEPSDVRKEMIDAFGAVMKAIRGTALKARAGKLDGKRSKEYWSTKVEMSARAYETYLIAKLQDQNASNDYLANIADEATWRAAEKLGFELDDSYPYPTAAEIPAIRAAFDHFFNTIQSKETETGVALHEPQAQYHAYDTATDAYDLFNTEAGAATTEPDRKDLPGDVLAADALRAAEYFVKTQVGVTQMRTLGAAKISNAADAAAATSYLYQSAVERFDAIVLDAHDTPLAVVGNFKGAVDQTAIYPATIIAEAVRVAGAAKIWFSHNHPSGSAELSRADVNLYATLDDAFRGSGITPMGILAIAGKRYVAQTDPRDSGTNDAGAIPAGRKGIAVPVIERELVDAREQREVIGSPSDAKAKARLMYQRNKTPGMLLLDSQNTVSAWVPLPDNMRGRLRDTGGLQAIYRAISLSNASGAILVHGGELDQQVQDRITVGQNIGAALRQMQVRVLDSINAETGYSAAERGDDTAAGPLFSRKASEIKKVVAAAGQPGNANVVVEVAPVGASEAEVLGREGLNVDTSFTHSVDVYAVRHAIKQHGDAKTEAARGQLALTADDFERIPSILAAPDAFVLGAKSNLQRDLIGYIKVMPDGTAFYLEEVRTGKKSLAMTSMRKYPAAKDATDAIRTVFLNVRNDSGDVRIVYPGAGESQANAPLFSQGHGTTTQVSVKSTEQVDAARLNRTMAQHLNDNDWSNAYEQVDLPDTLSAYAAAASAAFDAHIVAIRPTASRFDQFNGVNVGGTSFINIDGDISFLNITGHELYHDLERRRPDLHAWFKTQAAQHYRNFPAYQAKLNALVGKGEKAYTREAAESELLADFTGDALADPVFVGELAQADPAKFRALLQHITAWLKHIASKLRKQDLGSSHHFQDVDGLRKQLNQVLLAYANGKTIEQIQARPAPSFSREAQTHYSRADRLTDDASVANLFQAITQHDELFQYGTSDATDMQAVFDEVVPGLVKVDFAIAPDGVDEQYQVYPVKNGKVLREQAGIISVFPEGQVEINVSNWQPGHGGSGIYAAVGNWAVNNGKMFAGDRAGISPQGAMRRLESMISLALKFGTTDFIAPHPNQMRELGFHWRAGDTAYNLEQMLHASYNALRNGVYVTENRHGVDVTYKSSNARGVAKLDDLRYDMGSQQFIDTSNGATFTDEQFTQLAATAPARAVNAGSSTLKRAALAHTFMGEQGAGRQRLLELAGQLAHQSLEGTQLKGIFYSRKTPQTDTAQFKAWFGNSKVVDANGLPLVVYHGTRREFAAFNIQNPKGAPGNPKGVYFTADRRVAEQYAESDDGELDGKSQIIAAYIRIESDADGKVVDSAYRGREYVVFDPKNIKSATANNGAFDPDNNDIRFSRRQQGSLTPAWQGLSDSTLDNVIYALQDKHIDLRRVTQQIKQTAGDIDDRWNAYLQEELFHGRAAKRTQDFIKHELEPLITDLRLRGIGIAELEEYLWARHAEERNQQIAKVNPSMPDGGSGMTTQDARDYLQALTPKQSRDFAALAQRIDAINRKSRQVLVDYGLESQATIDAWQGAYQHYVPLMREDMDAGFGNGSGQGFSVKGNSAKRALGSNRAVVDILANIAQQRERYILRGEKNRVSTALIGLAQLNPQPEFWQVDTPPTLRDVNQATGLVEERTDQNYKSRDNVVVARIPDKLGRIQERAVIFNQFDARAMRMATSLKNLDQDQIGELLGASAVITRYFASINTQYNPMFGMLNITRDVQGALLNLSTTPIAAHKVAVLQHTLSALRGIYTDLRSERKTGTQPNNAWSALFEEFQQEGGQTGYRDMFSNARARGKALEHALDPHWWQHTKAGQVLTAGGLLAVPEAVLMDKAVKPLFDWLSDYNTALENAVRLAAYKVAKEQGISRQQAASIAKNITVNFNRKGEMGRQIGALYAFFNASVQGTARIAEVLAGPAGKRIAAGGVLLGVLQAFALAAAGFDDNEPPEFVRDRNLVIPIGSHKYLTIPMPLGFNVLPALGRIATEYAMGGFKDTSKRVTHLADVVLDMFNPIGNAGLSVQTLTPTVIDPLAALSENKDFSGRPIAQADFNALDRTPGFTRGKDTSSGFGKAIAYGVNYLTGGTDYKPGAISPTPDQIDYLAGQLTGGVGREAMKIEQTATAMVTGEALPTYKIPLVGRFYGNASGQSSQASAFYDNIRVMNEHENEIKGRRKDGLDVSAYRKEHPEAALISQAKMSYKIVSSLRKRERALKERGASRAQIQHMEEKITRQMQRLNDRVKARKAAADRPQ